MSSAVCPMTNQHGKQEGPCPICGWDDKKAQEFFAGFDKQSLMVTRLPTWDDVREAYCAGALAAWKRRVNNKAQAEAEAQRLWP